MKRLVLLSIVSMAFSLAWAADPSAHYTPFQKGLPNPKATKPNNTHSIPGNQRSRSSRSGGLQKVMIGTAGNMLSVFNSKCHQIQADNTTNAVLFIHRSDIIPNVSTSNVAQYRYDLSRNGGATWQISVGPLNDSADNVSINGRYPQAVIHREASQTSVDSSYIVYNGSWHSCGSSTNPCPWNGQYYGTGQLSGNHSTFTEHRDIINNQRVLIGTNMVESRPGYFFNLNQDFVAVSGTVDSIMGIWIERGIWDNNTRTVNWAYENKKINAMPVYDANGAAVSNALSSPTISFDQTGQYGWIMMTGDITNDNNFTFSPILMHTTDFGATWSAPQQVYLENISGMFPTPSTAPNAGKTILGDAEIFTDSAGNPHIIGIVTSADSTSNQYSYYEFQDKVLYDINLNLASSSTCGWQANFLSYVNAYAADYTVAQGTTVAAAHEGNRVQVAGTDDHTKYFVLWNDTDSADAVAQQATSQSAGSDQTNIFPNLMGVGVDLTIRKITNVVNFTAGDSLFGGQTCPTCANGGALTGSIYPVVSNNVRIPTQGHYNVPVVLTEPDYNQPVFANKTDANPARFWYCQNINFAQTDFVNLYDNAPPTIVTTGDDTVWIRVNTSYNPPMIDTAYTCAIPFIPVSYSTTVDTSRVGVYSSTWTAINPANGSSASHSQTVIVGDEPKAYFYMQLISGRNYNVYDTSVSVPDSLHSFFWGDRSARTITTPGNRNTTHNFAASGNFCVVLTVTNRYGTDTAVRCVTVAGINDVALDQNIIVYPNPSTGIVTINFADEMKDGAKVYMYNNNGSLVSAPVEIKANTTKTELNYTSLSAGLYHMVIETAKGNANKEITIVK